MVGLWRCDEFKPPALTGGGISSRLSDAVCIPKELPGHRYTRLFDGGRYPTTRWYPIPVREVDPENEQPSSLHRGYQYLWCQTVRVFLTATDDKLYGHPSFLPYHLLKNKDGGTAGALLHPNEDESHSLQQDTEVELIAIARGWSAVLNEYKSGEQEISPPPAEKPLTLEEEEVVREAHTERWSEMFEEVPWMDRFNEEKKKKQDGYHVLWIEWENGVAHRKGYGFVLEEEWDRVAETSRVDITLG